MSDLEQWFKSNLEPGEQKIATLLLQAAAVLRTLQKSTPKDRRQEVMLAVEDIVLQLMELI